MKTNTDFDWNRFKQNPIVGIIRGLSTDLIYELAGLYDEEGYYALEVTMNTPGVQDIISNLIKQYPNLCIGAGTVCNLNDLLKAQDAGAQFIVTPLVDIEVIKKCVSDGLTVFPGAFTPTEIYQAWDAGASAIKVFPANVLGPTYVKAVLAPLDHIKLIPTGGVNIANIESYLLAGAIGAGMGGSLFPDNYIKSRDWAELRRHLQQLKKVIQL